LTIVSYLYVYTVGGHNYFTKMAAIKNQLLKHPISLMISLHSYLVYTYEQQIFIDEIQDYSRRHIQLSSTRAHSGGQPNIFCFALFHWSERIVKYRVEARIPSLYFDDCFIPLCIYK
jgi:hypothetical protein